MALLYPDARVPTNPEITGVLAQAAVAERRAGRKNGDDLHLASTLLRIGSVTHALAAIGVDPAQARARVEAQIEALPKRGWAPLRVQMRMVRLVHHAADRAFGAGLAELDGPYLFATIVSLDENAGLLKALADVGFTLRAFRWYLAHGATSAPPSPESGPVEVILHNDPFTSMPLVVEIMTSLFGKDAAAAQELMMRVHEEGRAQVAVLYARDAAEKLARLRARADAEDAPLRATLSPVSS